MACSVGERVRPAECRAWRVGGKARIREEQGWVLREEVEW